MKQDRLDQRHHVPAGIVACTHNRHMDRLQRARKRECVRDIGKREREREKERESEKEKGYDRESDKRGQEKRQGGMQEEGEIEREREVGKEGS